MLFKLQVVQMRWVIGCLLDGTSNVTVLLPILNMGLAPGMPLADGDGRWEAVHCCMAPRPRIAPIIAIEKFNLFRK